MRALIAAATAFLTVFIVWDGLGGWLAKPWILFVVIALSLFLVLVFIIDAALIAKRCRDYAIVGTIAGGPMLPLWSWE